MGKAVAHGSKKSMAKQCLEDSITRKHLFELIGIKLRNEIRIMASENTGSFLQSTTTEELKSFSWPRVFEELIKHAPTLLLILQACTKTKIERKNTTSIVGTCAVIILKHRNSKMSLFQKMVSIILYAGHCSKQVR